MCKKLKYAVSKVSKAFQSQRHSFNKLLTLLFSNLKRQFHEIFVTVLFKTRNFSTVKKMAGTRSRIVLGFSWQPSELKKQHVKQGPR